MSIGQSKKKTRDVFELAARREFRKQLILTALGGYKISTGAGVIGVCHPNYTDAVIYAFKCADYVQERLDAEEEAMSKENT